MKQPTYSQMERTRACAWKASTATIPPAAKLPGTWSRGPGSASYDFCLPIEHAALSLLPEVREQALALFSELDITWHRARHHLLSSQVQCVNALGQMVDDPARVIL